MKLGNKARFKTEYLNGYPIVNLTAKHFDILPGYKFSAVSYVRPTAEEKSASAKVILLTKYGDLVEEDLEIEFEYTESQRLIEALKASSFKLRENALILDHPRKISNVDFVNKFEDVVIVNVVPQKTKNPDKWNLLLKVRFATSETLYDVIFQIDYRNLADVSNTGMVPLHPSSVNNLNQDLLLTFDDVEEFDINQEFIKGSPPVKVDPAVFISRSTNKIYSLEYIPPVDIDSRKAAFKVFYSSANYRKKVSKLIGFSFSKTIREAADLSMKKTYSSEFKYLNNNRLTLPVEISPEDFEYVGELKNLKIVDIQYNYNAIDNDIRFVPFNIIINFKSVNYKIEKILEFAYSKEEYFDGSFRESYQESESIIIPKAYSNALFLEKVSKNISHAKKELITNCRISKNFNYSKVLDIKITRFIPDSTLVIFAIKAEEQMGRKKIVHNFEKAHILDETLNEMLLDNLKPDDIFVKRDALTLAPDSSLDERAFVIPEFARLDSIQFAKPKLDSRLMNVQLKFKSGKKIVFLEKLVRFKLSILEFIQHQKDLQDEEYLKNIIPSDIMIKLDTNRPPVDYIPQEAIIGVPEGIRVELDYKKPKSGNRNARLFLKLFKGNSRITFEQSIMFVDPMP